MASIFGVSILKLNSTRSLNRLYKISTNHNVMQLASMTRLALKESITKPPPYPYWKQHFRGDIKVDVDPVTLRFDENTRLLVVDGPPAIGKTKFCEFIANEFGLLYMPPPVHEDIYIDESGYDKRELDPQLPPFYRSFILKDFLENPNDIRVNSFQVAYGLMRMEQYLIAMLHVISTGQGVVLNRCVFSDIAFVEAMCKSGYITDQVLKFCKCIRTVAYKHFLRPHLTIYLDAPIEIVQEKIKQRSRPEEIKSKVFNSKFLNDLENAYKEKYLKKLVDHTPILVYDWSTNNDYSYVVDDIESIDFDDDSNVKCRDWTFTTISQLNLKRMHFSQIGKYYNAVLAETMDGYLIPEELYGSLDDRIEADEVVDNNYHCNNYTMYDKLSFVDTLRLKDPYSLCLIRSTSRDLINYNNTILT